jgi:UDP-glucose 4-epimerase
MKTLIAGGLGYMGSALCELYRERDEHAILVLDKRFVPERVALFPEHMRFIQGDIRDLGLMRRLLADVDVVFVLAAEVQAESSIDRERTVWDQNFEAPKNLVEICGPGTRVVFPSTGNVFGGLEDGVKSMDLTEDDEPHPKYPYAEAKIAMERYLESTDRDYVVLRFGTNHGYSPGIRFDLVTNLFVLRAMQGEKITIHGSGENYRPTVSVKDCARALDFVSARPDVKRETFHVVRENFQIRELAEHVLKNFSDRGAAIQHIAKEVPFSAYALSSEKIKTLGFEFAWDLDASVKDMKRVFRAIEGNSNKRPRRS